MLLEILLTAYVTTYVAKNKQELGIPKAVDCAKALLHSRAEKLKEAVESHKAVKLEEQKSVVEDAIRKVISTAPKDEQDSVLSILQKYAVSDSHVKEVN